MLMLFQLYIFFLIEVTLATVLNLIILGFFLTIDIDKFSNNPALLVNWVIKLFLLIVTELRVVLTQQRNSVEATLNFFNFSNNGSVLSFERLVSTYWFSMSETFHYMHYNMIFSFFSCNFWLDISYYETLRGSKFKSLKTKLWFNLSVNTVFKVVDIRIFILRWYQFRFLVTVVISATQHLLGSWFTSVIWVFLTPRFLKNWGLLSKVELNIVDNRFSVQLVKVFRKFLWSFIFLWLIFYNVSVTIFISDLPLIKILIFVNRPCAKASLIWA